MSSEADCNRMGSPLELCRDQGVFWNMLRNTGEYDELVALAGMGKT